MRQDKYFGIFTIIVIVLFIAGCIVGNLGYNKEALYIFNGILASTALYFLVLIVLSVIEKLKK